MRAVLRLVWTYFTATPLLRGFAAAGVVCIVAGLAGMYGLSVFGSNLPLLLRRGPDTMIQWLILSLPWLGLILLLAASVLMPAVVARIALGRAIRVLPGGRGRLFASVVLTALLLALVVAGGATVMLSLLARIVVGELSPALLAEAFENIFGRTVIMAFIDFGLIYAAIWLVGKTSGIWRLAGTLGIVLSIAVPLRHLGSLQSFSLLEGLGLACWLLFAVCLLGGGRSASLLHRLRRQWRPRVRPAFRSRPYASGQEMELMLGTTRPWIVALGQIVPIAVMTWFIQVPELWIVFLVTFSAISGAMTSQAAGRSRRLWLRFDWSREQIRRQVTRAYLRYNACSLGILLVIYVSLANYNGLGFDVQALSIALMILASAACTYLGLAITRGLGWFESALGILTMSVLVLSAISIMRENLVLAFEFVLVLAGLGAFFFVLARHRWHSLDWMRCRAPTAARGAA